MPAKTFRQKLGPKAVAAQKLNPGIGADKRRRQIRDDDEDVQVFTARHLDTAEHVCHGQTNQRRHKSRNYGDRKTVDQGTPVIFTLQELDKIRQGQRPVFRIDHALVQDHDQGIDDKKRKESQDDQGNEHPDTERPFHNQAPS